MSGNCFFDTNVLVYYLTQQDQLKNECAAGLVEEKLMVRTAWISYQVQQELVNVAYKKMAMPSADILRLLDGALQAFSLVPSSVDLLKRAVGLTARFSLSFYDSLIVAAALESGCATLYSEDLQHGQSIDLLTIVNPFLS